MITQLDSQKGTLEVLLYINKMKKVILTEITKNVNVSQGPVYRALDILKKIGLIKEETVKFPKTRFFYPTGKGEELARRLALALDESKQVIGIPDHLFASLEDFGKTSGYQTVDECVIKILEDFLLEKSH